MTVEQVGETATKQKFELSNTVTLLTQHATMLNSLWATFAAITFVAAGYGLSVDGLGVPQATAITAGFLGFVFGHWTLLDQTLSVEHAAKEDILSAIAGDPADEFKSLRALCETVATKWEGNEFALNGRCVRPHRSLESRARCCETFFQCLDRAMTMGRRTGAPESTSAGPEWA